MSLGALKRPYSPDLSDNTGSNKRSGCDPERHVILRGSARASDVYVSLQ
jgi:hypothetical protein